MNPFSLDHIFPLRISHAICAAVRSSLSAHSRLRSAARHASLAAQSSGRPPPRRSRFVFPVPTWTDYAPLRSSFPRVVKELHVPVLSTAVSLVDASAQPFRMQHYAPLVGLVRVEPTTSRLSSVRSNHLSYTGPSVCEVTAVYTEKGGEFERERAVPRTRSAAVRVARVRAALAHSCAISRDAKPLIS